MGEEVEDLIKDFLVNQDLFSNGKILAKAVNFKISQLTVQIYVWKQSDLYNSRIDLYLYFKKELIEKQFYN